MIAKPKLPGLSDREPDFMWMATDSGSLYPVLIEIETPHKPWFYGDRAEIHSDFTHAHGQLAEWRAWFGRAITAPPSWSTTASRPTWPAASSLPATCSSTAAAWKGSLVRQPG